MADSPEDAEDAEDVEDAEEEEEMVKEEIENPKPEHYFISIFSKLSKLMCWSNIFNALVSWKDFFSISDGKSRCLAFFARYVFILDHHTDFVSVKTRTNRRIRHFSGST